MKKTLNSAADREVLALIRDVAYASVPAWYGATRRDLRMDVIAPKNREGHEPLPLVVWICGGAYRCVDHAVWVPEWVWLARKGYVVASIEYRTVNEGGFEAAYADVKSAIRYLKAHAAEYCVDPRRVAVMGESAGGTLASFAGLAGRDRTYDRGDWLDQDSAVNAVVDFYGIVDFAHDPIRVDGRDIPPFMMEDFLGLDYTPAQAAAASPMAYIAPDAPPFLIFHGTADDRVPVAQSESFYDALCRAGVPADLYLLEGAGHGADAFYQPDKLAIVEAFLEKTLRDCR